MARRFKLLRNGCLVVRMLAEERELLTRLPGELQEVVGGADAATGGAAETAGAPGTPGSSDASETPDTPVAPDVSDVSDVSDAPDASRESNPIFARLFPRAYLDPTEEEAETEFQRLVHEDLVRERLAAFSLVSVSLERATTKPGGLLEVELSPDETNAWLGVLNDARLALGTVLGVTEDSFEDDLDPDDPDTAPYAIYAWLTMLQGALLDALMS